MKNRTMKTSTAVLIFLVIAALAFAAIMVEKATRPVTARHAFAPAAHIEIKTLDRPALSLMDR